MVPKRDFETLGDQRDVKSGKQAEPDTEIEIDHSTDRVEHEGSLRTEDPSEAFRLKETIEFSFDGDRREASPAAVPEIPGYDVLRQLGQGGMGTVYLARDVRLEREVALKLLRAGATADPDELARFRSEAQAVARLQHPNIVQIFADGEHDGQLYFALEYVDGGDLRARLDGQPQPPKVAAEMLETIARAVHEAHQHQLVHRDLKPANILVSQSGQLKVTDFGLVKRLDAETAQTAIGTMAGTPCYMAPEQARGESHAVGPSADTYALGVMLYEALTGRPPFVGSSAMDVVMRVIHDPPLSPRRIDPKIPRDLETICLKCLEKLPGKRYATAEALADDLQRFRRGEPIVARPIGLPARTTRWCRRKPAHAASILLACLLAIGGWMSAVAYRAEFNRAEQNAQDAERNAREATKISDDVVDGARNLMIAVNRDLTGRPELEDVRLKILNTTIDWLNKFPVSPVGAERQQRTTSGYYQQMGDLMLTARRVDEAKEQYQQAFEIAQAMYEGDPDNYRYVRNLAASYNNLAQLEEDPSERQKMYQEALQLRLRWTELQPASIGARQAVAISRGYLCGELLLAGDPTAAKVHALEAQKWWAQIPEDVIEGNVEVYRERNSFYDLLGKAHLHNHEWKDALDCFSRARQHRVALWERDPTNSLLIHDAALAHRRVGDYEVLAGGDFEAAQKAYQQSLDRFAEYRDWAKYFASTAGNDRPLHDANRSLAKTHYRLGTAKLQRGDRSGAREDFRQSLQLMNALGPRNVSELVDLLLAASRCGEFKTVGESVAKLKRSSQAKASPRYRYYLACAYALCAWSASQDQWRIAPPGADPSPTPDEFTEKAIEFLRAAIDEGWGDLFELQSNPELDSIRDDPRFQQVLVELAPPSDTE